MTTGYNGAPAGIKSCEEKGECLRRKLEIPSGTKHELCFAVHAEQNAIISASREEMIGGTLYLVGYRTEGHNYEEGAAPCLMCRKFLINAGLEKVIVRVDKENYVTFKIEDYVKDDEFLRGQLSY